MTTGGTPIRSPRRWQCPPWTDIQGPVSIQMPRDTDRYGPGHRWLASQATTSSVCSLHWIVSETDQLKANQCPVESQLNRCRSSCHHKECRVNRRPSPNHQSVCRRKKSSKVFLSCMIVDQEESPYCGSIGPITRKLHYRLHYSELNRNIYKNA